MTERNGSENMASRGTNHIGENRQLETRREYKERMRESETDRERKKERGHRRVRLLGYPVCLTTPKGNNPNNCCIDQHKVYTHTQVSH